MKFVSPVNSLIKRILSAGALDARPWSKVRSIQLTNAIAFITASLFLILVIYLIANNGLSTVAYVGLVTILILLSVIALNYFQFHDLSRGLMCIIIPLAVLAAVFLQRIDLIGQYKYSRSPDVFI